MNPLLRPRINNKFRRMHGTWPMTGYWWRRYGARINRDAPQRHSNSCYSVLDPKRPCDCGVRSANDGGDEHG